jgi:DnaJ-domain-containing protein 1
MGQIWNRISRLAKSYLYETSDTSEAERIIGSDDDELKKIIDDLDKKKNSRTTDTESHEKQTKQDSEQKQQSQQKQKTHQQKQSEQYQKPRTSTGSMTLIKAAAVLGVRTDASVPEIKSAYKKKVMKFHPDRVANAPLDEQSQSKLIIVEVNQAYQFFQQLKGF